MPLPTPAAGGTPVILELNAQGSFTTGKNRKPKFNDVTNSSTTYWQPNPGAGLTYLQPGEYMAAPSGGCACVNASAGAGAVTSQTITVGVGPAGSGCVICATPTPTPTP